MSYQKNAWETRDFPQITKIRLNEAPVMMEFNPYEKGTMGGGFNPIILEFSDSPPFLEKDSPKKFHITRREIEVLQWLQQGKSSWEISKILGLSERTVNFHVYNVMEKIKAVNRLQMVSIALRLRLIDLK
jgi:DNA-binding CsgD family transcriptional regulator